tara:strand:+ start:329 stop:544 length:216 start_codon:yes stop_codon:yes gene_type:complete
MRRSRVLICVKMIGKRERLARVEVDDCGCFLMDPSGGQIEDLSILQGLRAGVDTHHRLQDDDDAERDRGSL